MGENLAEACTRRGHTDRTMLAHSDAVAHTVSFQLPARAVLGGSKVAAWDRAPSPLARRDNSLSLVARLERVAISANAASPRKRMLPAPSARHGKVGIALVGVLTGLQADVAQAVRVATAAARVHGSQRFAAILDHQSSRCLDGAGNAARQRGRRLEELAMRCVTEVEVQMLLAGG